MEKKRDGIMLKQGLKVLLVSDFHVNVYCWRKEIIEEIIDCGGKVALAVPYGEKLDYFKGLGCTLYDIKMDRHSVDIAGNLALIIQYNKVLKDFQPDIVLLYGSKGMLYCGALCRIKGIKYITNINGLGTMETSGFPVKQVLQILYRFTVPGSSCVFFQNKSNMNLLQERKLTGKMNLLIPGSGVNLETFQYLPFPKGTTVNFLFCARVMREKGIYQYIDAARMLSSKGIKARFEVVGMCDDDGARSLLEENSDLIHYNGFQNDVKPFIRDSHCIVLPSFYGEGISNSLLEGAASGRAIITTNMPGCAETVIDNVSGFVVKAQDSEDLAMAMEKFAIMPEKGRELMGVEGRKYVEKYYNRRTVVAEYMRQIEYLQN